MFKKVVISVPMEQFPDLALKRARDLANLSGSEIAISYIIEDNVFDKVQEVSKHVLTEKDHERWEKKMIRTHRKMANDVLMEEANRILGDVDAELLIQKGTYYEAMKDTISKLKADLLLMEYRSYDLLKYRIMDSSPIPVWIERNDGPIKKIGLFCTNLAPNKISPKASNYLKKTLNARLESYFIFDPAGKEDQDEPDRIATLNRIKWKGISNERVDSFIYRKAKERDLDLIILGRIKKRGYFHLRSKFAKRSKASVLLIN
jgi:nucleotide-binding universal stress UspA family protein